MSGEFITFGQSGELDVKWSRPSKLVFRFDGQFVFRAGCQPVELMNVIEKHGALFRILLVSLEKQFLPVRCL